MPRLKLGIEFVLADGAGILSRGKNSGIFNMTMMMVTMMMVMMMVVIVMTMVKKKHCETNSSNFNGLYLFHIANFLRHIISLINI